MTRIIAPARLQVKMTQPHSARSVIDARSASRVYSCQVDAVDRLVRNPRYHESSIVRESSGSLPE